MLPDNRTTSTACAIKATPTSAEALTDEAIVDRVCAGDLASFEMIMRRYNQRLYRVARGILRDDDEAQDVVQSTYVKAFEKLDQFGGRARFSTWLTKIAVYDAVARRRKRNRLRPFGTVAEDFEPMTPHMATRDAEARASNNELRNVLTEAVDQLPAELRSVFTLRMIEGLDTNETAECLELSAANVKTRLHRARSTLRTTIDARIGEDVRRLYQFDGERCDRIVANVMARIHARPNAKLQSAATQIETNRDGAARPLDAKQS